MTDGDSSRAAGADGGDDRALALAARLDRSRFVALYDRYAARIERYILARTGNNHLAEDLVSTTFMQALAHIDQYDPARGSFAAWLFAIARNAVRGHFRGETPLVPAGVPDSVPEDRPGPEEVALVSEEHQAVRQALEALTGDQREVLALRYLGELSFAEIARETGKSEAAAKMLARRGLDALRRELERGA